jgi:hypothetical protein
VAEQNWLLVLLKTDGGKGSATIMCQGIEQDPLFEDKVMLQGILGFFWPMGQHHVQVQAWSIPKDLILNWMLGPLRSGTPITMGTLLGEHKPVPTVPGVVPNTNLATAAEIEAALPTPDAPSAAAPSAAAPSAAAPSAAASDEFGPAPKKRKKKKRGEVTVG